VYKLIMSSRISKYNIDDFTSIKPGITILLINLYQESGQVIPIKLEVIWDGKSELKMNVL